MKIREIALATCPPVLWGVSYALAKPATGHLPPIFMMSIVYAISALMLLKSIRHMRTPQWSLFAIAAFGGAIQSSFIFTGISGLPASTSILVVQAQVPFAVLCAWLIGKEALNLRRLWGIAVSGAGIIAIAGAPEAVGNLRSLAFVIFGTLSWGIAQGLARRLGRDSGKAMTAAIMLYAAPQLLLASLILESGQWSSFQSASVSDWLSMLILALGGFVLAYSIWYGLLSRHRVDQVAPFILLMPLVGVLVSVALLGESLSKWSVIGGVIIVLGLAIIVIEPVRREKLEEGGNASN